MLNVSNLIDEYFGYVSMYSLAPAEPLSVPIKPVDYTIEVRPDVLDATDGPMLVHGLQGFHGPHSVSHRRWRGGLTSNCWRNATTDFVGSSLTQLARDSTG
jgi:hypothetical protein